MCNCFEVLNPYFFNYSIPIVKGKYDFGDQCIGLVSVKIYRSDTP